MQIRDNGKEVKIYFATVQPVVFSLPPDFDATGKTFSLAIRAERDVNTPALAEATGTVSAQLVTFSVDTDTQSFLDALRAGVSRAWLEIYVGDEDVLLQRPISIEPRAGSLEGQPPAPVVLYYTAAQVDALLAGKEAAGTAAAAVAAHNSAANAHPGTFDAAGAATSAVSDHNGDTDAHMGLLLGVSPSPGGVMTGRTDAQGNPAWVEQVGAWMQTVTGDFTAAPGAVYSLDLAENKTIYIDAAASADFDFALVVTMGATLRSLTLLPDMVSAILWSDGGNPPDYSTVNPAPALDTTLATYTLRFRYIAAENALHAELAATKDYNLPLSDVRGVFTSSGSTPVSSAMTISGGTVGTGYSEDLMNVYSRGKAIYQTVLGGTVTVYSGGVAMDAANRGGRTTVSAGGAAMTVSNTAGFVTVISGVISQLIAVGGYSIASSGGIVASATIGGTASAMIRGGTMTAPTISSGGHMHVSSGSVASAPTILNGGSMTVSNGGAALEVTSAAGAVVTVLTGGTITYKQ